MTTRTDTARGAERGALKTALTLIVAFMVGEIVAAVLASSLALLSDAAHMLTDAAALAMSLCGRAAGRAPGPRRDDLRPGPGRDPQRPGQRGDAGGARRW